MAHTSQHDFDELIDRAAALRKAGQREEAIDVYSKLLSQCTIGELYNERAVLYSECGDYRKAIIDLTDAIGLCHSDPDYYINRGNAYFWSGNYLSAIDDYSQALALSPNEPYAYNGRGQAFAELQRFTEARDDFEVAVQLDPEYVSPHFNVALLLYEIGEYGAALGHATRAVELNSSDPIAFCVKGDILVQIGDDHGAFVIFSRAVEIDSNSAEAHRRLCWLLSTSKVASLHRGSDALRHGQTCCQLTEWKNFDCLEAIAAAYAAIEEFDEAIHWQSKAVTLAPSSQCSIAKSRLDAYQSGRNVVG